MQNNNHENERVRPRLESASELKGKKAEAKSTSIGKKRMITLVSLLLVLAVAVGAYYITNALKPEEEIVEENTQSDIVSLLEGRTKNDMATMTVYNDGTEQYTVTSNLKQKAEIIEKELAAAAESGQTDAEQPAPSAADGIQDYEIAGMPEFTTDYDAVNSMAIYSYSIVANKLVAEDVEDLSVFGLDDPAVQVHYTYHDGGEMRFNMGSKVPAGDYYYMNLDDSHDVYMVYKTVYNYFVRDLTELHSVPVAPAIDPENLVYLLAEQNGKETVEIVLRGDEDSTSVSHVKLIQPFEYDVNSDRASQTMISASALKLTGYAGRAADETALAEYGLAEPFAHVEVADSNDVKISMTIGDIVEGNSALRYATVDDSGDVYTVDASLLAFLGDCRVSYLIDQFAGLVNVKSIDGFTITTPDKTYTTVIESTPYTREDGTEMVKQDFYFQGQYVNEDLYRDFYQVVIGRLVDKRIENEEDYFFDGDVVLSISYDLNYQDEPHVIEYLDYDRDYCAVRRDGVCLFLIRKDKVQEIVDTAELLEKGEYQGIDDTIDYQELYGDMSYYE